ncbi:MAG TPA: type II toxin-antitoxin system HicB family antitoxin [Candidatus Nitrosotenuis sp.]|jgi:predicted RNase H-like HicB family nuclease|nr:MAG: HicB family protein [Nitrosopumilales archaeon CG11_big_fil_rev_8_21_14_0_20_33_24]PIY89885.1 MAG: type II toxin-antitoxin system HicB family antitoxin [Nitrosopumilales archaeon CG_4_10_14_0_8_um_filter_34_8]PJB98930.1 MAG: type II toxin-antitoxin system HicB family antitoxin [Nitrosopumilales archaeon CG_4_9_14_0_8_um_filter_34_10]
MTEGRKFTIRTTKDPTGGYSGRCLELPAAISEGETLEELMVNMKEVIQIVLESIEKDCPADEKIVVTIPT